MDMENKGANPPKTFDYAVFFERLKEITKNATQKEIAEKIGVNEATISRWKTSKKGLCADDLLKLSAAYGCSIDYLLGNDLPEKEKELTLHDVLDILFKAKNNYLIGLDTKECKEEHFTYSKIILANPFLEPLSEYLDDGATHTPLPFGSPGDPPLPKKRLNNTCFQFATRAIKQYMQVDKIDIDISIKKAVQKSLLDQYDDSIDTEVMIYNYDPEKY